MLYNSIIFLIFCILVLIIAYNYNVFEEFSQTTGYKVNSDKMKGVLNSIAKNDMEFNEFKKNEGVRKEALAEKIDSLKQIISSQLLKKNIFVKSSKSSESDDHLALIQSFDNKELYSILVNALSSQDHTRSLNTYGTDISFDNSDKFKFTTLITSTIDVACRLLQQKQDYKYIVDCVKTTRGSDRIGKIHTLIVSAYNYINNPKLIKKIEFNNFLIQRFGDNIKELILVGRRIILDNGNICHCNYAKSSDIIKTQLLELKQMYDSISQQEITLKAELGKNNPGLPSWIPNSNFLGMNISSINTSRISNDLTQLSLKKSAIINKLQEYKKKMETIENDDNRICKPC